jgi:hypothetical protein
MRSRQAMLPSQFPELFVSRLHGEDCVLDENNSRTRIIHKNNLPFRKPVISEDSRYFLRKTVTQITVSLLASGLEWFRIDPSCSMRRYVHESDR